MKTNKLLTFTVAALITSSIAIAGHKKPAAQMDIVDTAVSAKGFTTLVTAVKAAGLVEALKGKGPRTVFAPTDAAFEKLEKSKPGTIAMLLKPENKSKLVAILTYHVVPGNILAVDVMGLKNGTHVKTLNGKSICRHEFHDVAVDACRASSDPIVGADESRHERRARLVIELLWRSDLLETAGVHHGDVIG